ncbi:hypothetical protein AgCh_039394 [Apium graveolens]
MVEKEKEGIRDPDRSQPGLKGSGSTDLLRPPSPRPIKHRSPGPGLSYFPDPDPPAYLDSDRGQNHSEGGLSRHITSHNPPRRGTWARDYDSYQQPTPQTSTARVRGR